MVGIADVIVGFKEFGIFDFYLPFLIMFAIFWVVLKRAQIFGDPDKDKPARLVNLLLSLGGALFIMAYTPVGITLTTFFANFFGQLFVVILTVVAFVMILFVVGGALLGKPGLWEIKGKKTAAAIVLLFIVIGIGIFFSSGGAAFFPGLSFPAISFPSGPLPAFPSVPGLPAFDVSTTDLAIIFLVVATGFIIWWVAKGTKEEKKKEPVIARR